METAAGKRCYLCFDREAEVVRSQVPVCGRCADDYLSPVTTAPPPKAEAKPWAGGPAAEAPKANYRLHLDIWRFGGCIFCGSTTNPRPKMNKLGHGVCFSSASDDLRQAAKEAVLKEKT